MAQQPVETIALVKELKLPDGRIDFKRIYSEGLTMASAVKELGAAMVTKFLVIMISDLCKRFNVVRNMSEDQILEYALEQVAEYPGYRLEDYFIFFQEAKRGRYGVPFDHVDAAVIDSWFEKYHQQRVEAKYEIHEEYKNLGAGPRMSTSQQSNPLDERFASFGAALGNLKALVAENKERLSAARPAVDKNNSDKNC